MIYILLNDCADATDGYFMSFERIFSGRGKMRETSNMHARIITKTILKYSYMEFKYR